MKRRYTRSDYIETARKLKAAVPGFLISTDIIVGFPGETEADFQETLSLYETVQFSGAFSFKYSSRPGTVSAMEMPNDVPEQEKSRRLDELHKIIEIFEREAKRTLVGQPLEILVEGPARLPGQITGRARNNQIVNITLEKDSIIEEWIGKLITVTISKSMPHSLEGEP
jgi:tRNA-2-methylthio-N6-dimethylallyladenosine synthase